MSIKFLLIFCIVIALVTSDDPTNNSTNAQNKEKNKPEDFDLNLLPGNKIKEENEIKKFLADTDMTVFAFFYKQESKTSKEVGFFLNRIASLIKYFAEIITINCSDKNLSQISQCSNNNQPDETFVFFEIYQPQLYKYNPYTNELLEHTRHFYQKDQINEKDLLIFIQKHVIFRGQEITNENYDNFISNNEFNKLILFTEKKTIPITFRGLSNYFYNRILIGVVKSSEKDLCQKLGVKKFPTLMLYQSVENGAILDEPHIEILPENQKVAEIIEYLSKYALKEKKYRKGNQDEDKKKDFIFKHVEVPQLVKHLEENKNKNVIIYFDNNESVDASKNIENLPEDIIDFNSQTHGFFRFVYANCQGKENLSYCGKQFKIEQFPSMVLFKDSKNVEKEEFESTSERIQKGVHLSLEISEITKEIKSTYEGNLREVNRDNFILVMREIFQENKIPIIYAYDSYVQMAITLLSRDENIGQGVVWVAYENPAEDFLRSIRIKKMPGVVLGIPRNINKGEMSMLPFDDKISYSKLKNFIDKTLVIEDRGEVKRESTAPVLNEITTTDELVKTCSLKKLCMIGFFDMRNKEAFEEKFNIFKNASVVSNNRFVTFGYVNGTCQSEFGAKFGIDSGSLPNLVLYSYKKDVYANFIGAFQEEDISEFVTKVISGRAYLQKIQKENAFLNTVNCTELVDVVENDDDDDIMKEIIEEEKRKREEFEKEREKLNPETAKKKKKKKKKKKNKEKKEEL